MFAYWESSADIAFRLFLDAFDVAAFSDVEFRMYQQARLRRTA
jgi:hypothetical protein